jgi:hypothetical protein
MGETVEELVMFGSDDRSRLSTADWWIASAYAIRDESR